MTSRSCVSTPPRCDSALFDSLLQLLGNLAASRVFTHPSIPDGGGQPGNPALAGEHAPCAHLVSLSTLEDPWGGAVVRQSEATAELALDPFGYSSAGVKILDSDNVPGCTPDGVCDRWSEAPSERICQVRASTIRIGSSTRSSLIVRLDRRWAISAPAETGKYRQRCWRDFAGTGGGIDRRGRDDRHRGHGFRPVKLPSRNSLSHVHPPHDDQG